jgi:branched-chain amino acid transport system ATP-binding protein
MSTPLLEVDAVHANYGGDDVLKGISLSVAEASIVAVLGANGAGKSTLLKVIAGSHRSASGDVRLSGTSLLARPQEQLVTMGLGYVPEGHGIIGELTVDENLALGALWRKDREQVKADIAQVYELFERLAERRSYQARQLSGGERQMLALGRALAGQPRILLLDEPSLGLAPRIVADTMAIIRDLRDTRGVSVLLVEQNAHSALTVADVGVVISLGEVVVQGSPAELDKDEELRHAYLGF